MILQYPLALALLALIPILILLHSIRTRRRDAEVSSLFLWEQALKESSRRFRLRRVLRNLSLLLQILAVLLLVAALARPALLKPTTETRNVVIVIDTSASMKSRWNGRSRLEEAKRAALDGVDSLGIESRMLVIEASSRPILRTSYTQDREKIKAILRDARGTDEPGSMRDAFLMALSLVEGEGADEIWIATDGAFEDFEEIRLSDVDVRLLKVEDQGKNLGITQFEFRSLPGRQDQFEILVAVNSYTDDPVSAPLVLSVDGTPYLETTVALQPMEERVLIFGYQGLVAETAMVELRVNDSFATDNRAFAVLSQSRGIRILLVTEGNSFLEAVFSVYPNARLEKNLPTQDYGDYDMVVFDRVDPPPLVSGNYLLVDTVAQELPIRVKGALSNPEISSWDPDHPILRSLSLRGIRIQQAAEIELQGDARVLAAAGNSPLLVSYESRRIRTLYMGFDLLQSDLPLKTAFPVLMGNILRWYYPGSLSSATRQVQAGSPYPITPKGFKFDIRGPDGTVETVAPLESPYLYEKTDVVGIYTVKGSDFEESFAVNLASREESDIRPRFEVPRASEESRPREEAAAKSRHPFSYAFVLAFLAVLLLEWAYWVKKW